MSQSMSTQWKYRIGDIVGHKDQPELVGVITRCRLGCEVDPDMGTIDPWYMITWTSNPQDEQKYQMGQEYEGQLTPIFRPVDPEGHPFGYRNPNGFEL